MKKKMMLTAASLTLAAAGTLATLPATAFWGPWGGPWWDGPWWGGPGYGYGYPGYGWGYPVYGYGYPGYAYPGYGYGTPWVGYSYPYSAPAAVAPAASEAPESPEVGK